MKNAFFFQTKQIPDHAYIFDQFKQHTIFFSCFQVDQKYYLFFYSQKPMEIDFLYPAVEVIQELDSKKRKIRSLRGFLLYALEIIDNGKDYEILSTNLQPFFWRKVENILRQNKKGALQEFLFGSNLNQSINHSDLQKKIQNLQNQLNSLQQKVIDLEPKVENPKYARRGQTKASEAVKSIQQEDSQTKAQNDHNFITLGKISEQEKVEIIKLGFQLNQDGKISLKKYYEEKGEHTLFESKGYQIKYDSIRKTKLYQQFGWRDGLIGISNQGRESITNII
jgi:hypothetical protein